MSKPNALVAIIMGSDSDWPVMKDAAALLDEFQINYEARVVSAHRTPVEMIDFGKSAVSQGFKVIIAGAGGAAHLPGMIAAVTPLPVIGVPVRSSNSMDGWDSVLSILQMPKGVPVATVALDNATNAALLAVRILGTYELALLEKMSDYQEGMRKNVLKKRLGKK